MGENNSPSSLWPYPVKPYNTVCIYCSTDWKLEYPATCQAVEVSIFLKSCGPYTFGTGRTWPAFPELVCKMPHCIVCFTDRIGMCGFCIATSSQRILSFLGTVQDSPCTSMKCGTAQHCVHPTALCHVKECVILCCWAEVNNVDRTDALSCPRRLLLPLFRSTTHDARTVNECIIVSW